MTQYNVTGMTCAACVSRVEKAVNNVPGVESCAVSLLTNSMGITGDADVQAIINAVQKAGYNASLKGGKTNVSQKELEDTESAAILKRLVISVVILIILMYFSMGHMMFGWPIPPVLYGNHIAMGLLQLLLTTAIMVINQRFFISGFKALFHRSPNMDTLVSLGSSAAYIYSLCALFAMTNAQILNDSGMVIKYMDEMYFESAGTILTLITIGKFLEAKSKGKTTNALKSLMDLSPKMATVLRNDRELTIPASEVNISDLFIVRPGESVPVDGIIVKGHSALDESALTGESLPVEKSENDSVSAGTLNTLGFLTCKATKVGEYTTLSQIIKMVSDAAATKAPIAKIADKVSGIFVPTVITISVITLIVWLIAGGDIGFSLARAISVLVISCPCALGLATPVAIMVGSGMGARNGILFKTAASLENTGKTEIICLDKTGTITKGMPEVTDIISRDDSFLQMVFGLEKNSEHPLAKAVCRHLEEKGIIPVEVTDSMVYPGGGITGSTPYNKIFGGNAAFLEKSGINIPSDVKSKGEALSGQGKTPLYFGAVKDNVSTLLGMISLSDTIKEDSPSAISQLKNLGIKVLMLTGDGPLTAKTIGSHAGVDEVIAGVLPDGKEKVVRERMSLGHVAMVGDGINDAPALTCADIGIAIGAGTDVAIESADLVLMKSSLLDVPKAIRLSRATLRNIKQNLFWAFIYNVIGIPLAAGVFIVPFGLQLNPMIGALAMSLSSVCVVGNALRLNLINISDGKKDKPLKHASNKLKVEEQKKENVMEKTFNVSGMMCHNCENHVKKALGSIPGVTEVSASHESGIVKVTLSQEVADEKLIEAITEEGYKVELD